MAAKTGRLMSAPRDGGSRGRILSGEPCRGTRVTFRQRCQEPRQLKLSSNMASFDLLDVAEALLVVDRPFTLGMSRLQWSDFHRAGILVLVSCYQTITGLFQFADKRLRL
jgi:hypothetical protein